MAPHRTAAAVASLKFTADGARRATAYTVLHDWVRLSGITAQAVSLYWAIKMHVYYLAGDKVVEDVTTDTLAQLCNLGRGDKVARYLRELENIGALETVRTGMYGVNAYLVHEDPPDGYQGPVTLKQWYEMQAVVRQLKGALKPVDNPVKAQVSDVPPETGQQAAEAVDNFTNSQVSGVAPKTGEQGVLPSKGGNSVPPKRGLFYVPAPSQEIALSPTSPSGGSAPSPEEGKEREREDLIKSGRGGRARGAVEADLVVELAAVGRTEPEWNSAVLAEVLADPAIRIKPWPLVVLGFRLAVEDKGTWSPRRMLAELCPHWRRATGILEQAGQPDPDRTTPTPVWCGNCHRQTRMVSRDQLDPATSDRSQVPCPACSPTVTAA